jgi:T5SS/PEP-CTERM-associated repeat protein
LRVGDSTSISASGTASGSGKGTLNILGGGVVNDNSGSIDFKGSTVGTVLVSGAGSAWNNATTLDIGSEVGSGSGLLTIKDGGLVTAKTATVWANGTLAVGCGGTLKTSMVVDGGADLGCYPSPVPSLSQRTSPVSLRPATGLTIGGNFTLASDGTLLFQVAGAGAQDYSDLAVDGNGTFSGLIDFDFVDGYAPVAGQAFTFILDSGSADFSKATFEATGLGPGFRFSTDFSDGALTVTADNNGSAARAPEPSSPMLAGIAFVVLSCGARRRKKASL